MTSERPFRARPRRADADARNARLRARTQAIVLGAAFGPDHPAIISASEHLAGFSNALTARQRADHLRALLDWCHARRLDPFELRRAHAKIYYSELPSHLARSSRHVRMSAIRSWFVDAIDARLCVANAFYRVGPKNIDPRNPTPYISLEEVDRVLEYRIGRINDGSASPCDFRDTIMFYVMTRVGPRRFEVAGALWSSLEVRDGVTRWALHGKGDEDARTTLPLDVVEMLANWRRYLARLIGREVRPDDALFPVLHQGAVRIMAEGASAPLECLAPGSVGVIYKNALTDVGITGIRMAAHVARATAATLAYRSGASERDIQRMLRHRIITTTHRYIRLVEDIESPAESWKPIDAIDFSAKRPVDDPAAGRSRKRKPRSPRLPRATDATGDAA